MKTEQRSIGDVQPYPGNPRSIGDAAVKAVAESLDAFGWRQPIVVDRAGVIIVGHTRRLAALRLGMDTVPVHVADLSDEQARAYRLADNKTGELAAWDPDLLVAELAGLEVGELDMGAFGFEDEDFGLTPGSVEDDGPVPAAPAEPITQPGTLWCLGRHRLLCGDATVPETVARVLAGNEPALMVTDPPYGIGYEPKWREDAGKPTPGRSLGPVRNDDRSDWRTARCGTSDGSSMDRFAGRVALERCGFTVNGQLVWAKNAWSMSAAHYKRQHELCWYAARAGARWDGDTATGTVMNVRRPSGVGSDGTEDATPHPTQKPVECMANAIRNHAGDVYDPFLGSGTTLIAAEQLGRRCFAVEIDPGYCDVAVQRFEALTGLKAVREAAPSPPGGGSKVKKAACRIPLCP